MSNLSQLTRQHYEKDEAEASLVSEVRKILDSLPDGVVDSLRLAGLDQFQARPKTSLDFVLQKVAGNRKPGATGEQEVARG